MAALPVTFATRTALPAVVLLAWLAGCSAPPLASRSEPGVKRIVANVRGIT